MTLHALLDANLQLDAEYDGGLANHLPMALVALQALGASDARLQAFAATYRRKLVSAPTAADWPAGEAWGSRLGVAGAWSAYRSLFAQWLTRDGHDAVLRQALPALMSGCGGAAFHGLIRTACAMRSGHDGELADGLAYWACCHLQLHAGAGEDEGDTDDPGMVLQALRHALDGWRANQRLIVQRMQAAALQAAFAPQTRRLRIGADSLGALARLATRLYAQGGNFTVLHLVTSCHALRLLLPYLDEPLPALRSFWAAYAAGAASLPDSAWALVPQPLPLPLPTAVVDWPQIAAKAISADDEHVIKLVYSAREEHRHYGWEDCRQAAVRAVTSD